MCAASERARAGTLLSALSRSTPSRLTRSDVGGTRDFLGDGHDGFAEAEGVDVSLSVAGERVGKRRVWEGGEARRAAPSRAARGATPPLPLVDANFCSTSLRPHNHTTPILNWPCVRAAPHAPHHRQAAAARAPLVARASRRRTRHHLLSRRPSTTARARPSPLAAAPWTRRTAARPSSKWGSKWISSSSSARTAPPSARRRPLPSPQPPPPPPPPRTRCSRPRW